MKIEQVHIMYNAIMFPCLKCGNMINVAIEPVWADLDGPAFKAYYHTECRPNREEKEDHD